MTYLKCLVSKRVSFKYSVALQMPKPLLWLLLLAASLNAIQAEEFVDVDRKSRSDPDFSHIIDEPNHVGEIGDKVNVSVVARHFSSIRKKY